MADPLGNPAGPVDGSGGEVVDGSRPAGRARGLREALLVGELVVVTVLLAGVVTYLLPGDLKDIVLRTPLLILILLVGTAGVLWQISRPSRPRQ